MNNNTTNIINKPIDNVITVDIDGNIKFSNDFIKSYNLSLLSTCSFIESDNSVESGLKGKAFFVSFDSKVPYGSPAIPIGHKEFINEPDFYFKLSEQSFNILKEKLGLTFEKNGKEQITLNDFKVFEMFGDSIGYKLFRK